MSTEKIAEGLTIVHPFTCDYCGKEKKECLAVQVPYLLIFKKTVYICETCIHKSFRAFDPEK